MSKPTISGNAFAVPVKRWPPRAPDIGWATSIIGIAGALCACAALQKGWSSETAEGRWRGSVVRGGYRQAISVDLERTDLRWVGTFNAGDRIVPLEHLAVGGDSIHFETPDDLAFDGRLDGDSMVGVVSGSASGPLTLSREPSGPHWQIARRDPREPVLMFGPP